ncbi:histidine phosphatase family protein [Photobacterium sp. SDRW27]|uniref:histidine phosphatase family protein n=1 Tax=Photobacterium obscurum TaxID=2829490 RepID=UPI002242DC5B|nr:histidine phosphatase family protein [Photobacterium obscurum]MCW8329137.1 histidine phosphatase family protein [Photobacterium obscurum]
MRLVLIRHGQTEWNRQKRIQGWLDSPLTSSALIGLHNLDLPLLQAPVVYSSDLGRAFNSAAIVAKSLGTEVVVDKRLRERQFGLLEGEVIDHDDALKSYWQRYHQRYEIQLNDLFGAEPEQKFEQRIVSFFDDLHRLHAMSDVVLVSHGEWLRAFLNLMNDTPSWHKGDGIQTNAAPIVLEWSPSIPAIA